MSVTIRTAEQMQALAARVASHCRAGDLVLLTGDLGAGKTTFTQGFGRAMGVREPITSPTFVIARVYRPASGPGLVHVDAYRVGDALELDDLDIDADLADCVTVVEWGEGKAERLSSDRLHVVIERSDDVDDETRIVTFTATGDRWSRAVLDVLDMPMVSAS